MIPDILRFHPIYKEKIWGGRKFATILGRSLPEGTIGETWEISDYGEDQSQIAGGIWSGRTLRSVCRMYPREVLGFVPEVSGFPLLVKLIDAREKLSVQVHPSDEYSQQKDPQNPGKMEAWIVMQADPGSELTIGFSRTTSREEYRHFIESNQAESILRKVPVRPGDAFLLEPGTIHAIGGGIVLLEIQQSSDSTYRVYDYGRPRELHLEKALDVLNYCKSDGSEKLEYKRSEFIGAGTLYSLTENSKFRIYILDLNSDSGDEEDYEAEDYILPSLTRYPRFHIYSILEGKIQIGEERFQKGDSFLMTAQGFDRGIVFSDIGEIPARIVVSTIGSDYD